MKNGKHSGLMVEYSTWSQKVFGSSLTGGTLCCVLEEKNLISMLIAVIT